MKRSRNLKGYNIGTQEMSTKNKDILLIKGSIWISQGIIIDTLGYSNSYFKRVRYGKDVKSWSHQKVYGEYYYDYMTIPKKERLGEYGRLLSKAVKIETEDCKYFAEKFKDTCIDSINKADIDYYKLKIRELGKSEAIREENARELAQLNAFFKLIMKEKLKVNNISKDDFWRIIMGIGNELCPRFFKLKNLNSFRNKIAGLPSDENELRELLFPKKIGNQNTRKIGRYKFVDTTTGEIYEYDLHQIFIYMLYANIGKSNKLNLNGIYEFYCDRCKVEKLTPVSLSTVKNYIYKNSWWMDKERHGEDSFNSKWKPYISQEKVRYRGSMWVADWSSSKLAYKEINSKLGYKSLYIFRIYDMATGKIMGWSVGDGGEKAEQMIPALKMAVKNNGGYGCYEFVTDNGPSFGNQGKKLIETIALKHRKISLGNKQANKAEYFIKRMSEFARQYENWIWTGFNSSNKAENRANEDYFNLENLPNKEEALQQWERLIEQYNDKYGKQIEINPKLTLLEEVELRKAFDFHSIIDLKISRGIIKLRKNNKKYEFDVNNYSNVLCKMDMHKKSDVDIYWDEKYADIWYEGKYLDTLKLLQKAHSTDIEATDMTERALKLQKDKKRSFENDIDERIRELASITESLGYRNDAKIFGTAKNTKQKLEENHMSKLLHTKYKQKKYERVKKNLKN